MVPSFYLIYPLWPRWCRFECVIQMALKKEAFLRISEKSVKNWKNAGKCTLELNGTFILPDLPIMAPGYSSVSSDLSASFKQSRKKKRLLRVSEKLVKNWRNAGKCALELVCAYPLLSIRSGELLRYWVISFISSKMLPSNLIQLDNPPEIKFCAFYKVCHKKFKKILIIKKVSPNSRLD